MHYTTLRRLVNTPGKKTFGLFGYERIGSRTLIPPAAGGCAPTIGIYPAS
jgi:hypothetical protein